MMPQIYMILSPKADRFIGSDGFLACLDERLSSAVANGFRIAGHDDVVFTAVVAKRTRGEADVQIEIRYTVGKDEYDMGHPFDPPPDVQIFVGDLVNSAFNGTLQDNGLKERLSLSVFFWPNREGIFKMYANDAAPK